MAYCTVTDISNAITSEKVKQLTDDPGLGQIDQALVAAVITAADELINGFLRAGGYTLPLASTPPILLDVSVDIVVFKLYERKFRTNMPESIVKKYDSMIKLMKDIQKRVFLIGADTAVEAVGGNYASNKTAEDRVFTQDVLDTY
jgi:phage gp36-like protein